MTILKTLAGSGALIVDGREVGQVDYQLIVSRHEHLISGSGSLSGGFDPLYSAFDGEDTRLQLPAGQVRIIIINLNDEDCLFKTTGEIPGVL